MNKNIYHTHQCRDLDINSVGQRETLSGWVAMIRKRFWPTSMTLSATAMKWLRVPSATMILTAAEYRP